MRCRSRRWSRAFTLAELLVVIGVIALLLALIIPPLEIAKREAMRATCMRNLQQLGVSLQSALTEYDYYPIWDDDQNPTRFTWIDVLVQGRLLADYRLGYCSQDNRPDQLNAARAAAMDVYYPGTRRSRSGIDYSYGIGVPLSAGGWNWVRGYSSEPGPRRFEKHDRDAGRRVLAGDAYWSYIYNLSGDATLSAVWNDPNWFDNTVAWRHGTLSANLLLQDGHVSMLSYHPALREPVKTSRFFVWHSGEPIHAGPDTQYGMNLYPNEPPPGYATDPPGNAYPHDLNPAYYSDRQSWTLIRHK